MPVLQAGHPEGRLLLQSAAPGSPPGVRRPSTLREGLAAGAARTSSMLRLGSGAVRRRGSEMVRSNNVSAVSVLDSAGPGQPEWTA